MVYPARQPADRHAAALQAAKRSEHADADACFVVISRRSHDLGSVKWQGRCYANLSLGDTHILPRAITCCVTQLLLCHHVTMLNTV